MKVERCPHCKSMAMFAVDHCSRCRKHRSTGAGVSLAALLEVVAPFLGQARDPRLRLANEEHAVLVVGAVAVVRDAELQPDHRGEHEHDSEDRARHHGRRELDADRGADHGRDHGEREKQVGIAQDLLALGRYGVVLRG